MATRLRKLPVTAAAWRDGILSGGQVEVILTKVRRDHLDRFADHEADLVPWLAPLSVDDTAAAMDEWKRRADADGTPPPDQPPSALHLSKALDDRWAVDGDLDAESGEIVATALRLATTDDGEGEPARLPSQRRADALVDTCRFFLDTQQHRRGGRHRPHLNVVITREDRELGLGGHTVTGTALERQTVSRMLCDCVLHRVVVDGRSAIIDYGTATRVITVIVWNALVLRDRHCWFPGCDRPATWCDAHHVWHWEDGGPTCLSNLVLLCRRHHTLLHTKGWEAKLRPDGTLEVTSPEGWFRTTEPPFALRPPPLELPAPDSD
jgi:hypothetical protein